MLQEDRLKAMVKQAEEARALAAKATVGRG